MLDTEALLLIDHHQAQVLEGDLARQQPMSADDDIDPAIGETLDGRSCLSLRGEPAERCDVDREAGIAIGERGVVLLHQQGRRNQRWPPACRPALP